MAKMLLTAGSFSIEQLIKFQLTYWATIAIHKISILLPYIYGVTGIAVNKEYVGGIEKLG